LADHSRDVLGPDLVDLAVSDLAPYHDREAFSGEPAHSDPTLPSPHRSPWERIHILEDDRTLRISFVRGVVTYLHHVEVQIDRWAVDVTLYLGHDRAVWERVERGGSFGYTLVGIREWTEIVLDEPVGDRYVRGFDAPD